MNAELGGWDYDQTNQVLLLKLSDGKWITLHPQKIAIRGARDMEEAQALLAWIQAQINDIYARREAITPRYVSQAGLKVMEILKLLPHDQLQGLRLRHLHGLCRGPAGRGDYAWRTARLCGKKNTGKSGKSSRPTWKASAGGPWTQINEKGFRCEHLFRPFPLSPVS